MAPQTLQSLRRALKAGTLAPVYYFYGPEDALKEEVVRALLDRALEPATSDFNLDQRSAAQLEPETFDALVNTLPMMADRRVVLLRDAEALKKKGRARPALLRYLERPSADTVLVLVQGGGEEEPDAELARHAFAVDFQPLGPEETLEWLLRRARALGIAFAPGAAEHLLRAVGNDLRALRMEVEKLGGLGAGREIGVDDVGALVGVRRGETLWDWRDAVLDDRPERALPLLGPVLEQSGVSGVRLVTTLGGTLVGVAMTRATYDRNVRGRALEQAVLDSLYKRVRPFAWLRDVDWKDEAARWARWAGRWPAPRTRRAVEATLAADRALKSTRITDERGVLADLVMTLSLSKQEVA